VSSQKCQIKSHQTKGRAQTWETEIAKNLTEMKFLKQYKKSSYIRFLNQNAKVFNHNQDLEKLRKIQSEAVFLLN